MPYRPVPYAQAIACVAHSGDIGPGYPSPVKTFVRSAPTFCPTSSALDGRVTASARSAVTLCR
jgi:hypothetical protein